VVASFVARSCSTLSPVSAGMGDRLRAGIPPRYVTKPTRSTQSCFPLGSLNRVPALIGTLCDPTWHVSSRSGAVLVAQTAIRFLTLPYLLSGVFMRCLTLSINQPVSDPHWFAQYLELHTVLSSFELLLGCHKRHDGHPTRKKPVPCITLLKLSSRTRGGSS